MYPISPSTDSAEIRYARPPEVVGYFQFPAILVHKKCCLCKSINGITHVQRFKLPHISLESNMGDFHEFEIQYSNPQVRLIHFKRCH
jgi:hypothetical protein